MSESTLPKVITHEVTIETVFDGWPALQDLCARTDLPTKSMYRLLRSMRRMKPVAETVSDMKTNLQTEHAVKDEESGEPKTGPDGVGELINFGKFNPAFTKMLKEKVDVTVYPLAVEHIEKQMDSDTKCPRCGNSTDDGKGDKTVGISALGLGALLDAGVLVFTVDDEEIEPQDRVAVEEEGVSDEVAGADASAEVELEE